MSPIIYFIYCPTRARDELMCRIGEHLSKLKFPCFCNTSMMIGKEDPDRSPLFLLSSDFRSPLHKVAGPRPRPILRQENAQPGEIQ